MMIQKLNKTKTPIVTIDPSLNKLSKKVLFKDKLAGANQVLKTIGVPQTK